MYTVRMRDYYSDDHVSEPREVKVEAPAAGQTLDEWWEDVVWEHTGDGHNADKDLGYCHTAIIVEVEGPHQGHVGENTEWAGN